MEIKPPAKRITYRLREFAVATGIPYRTVWDRVKAGKIPSVNIGGTVVIPAAWVEALLKAAYEAHEPNSERSD